MLWCPGHLLNTFALKINVQNSDWIGDCKFYLKPAEGRVFKQKCNKFKR